VNAFHKRHERFGWQRDRLQIGDDTRGDRVRDIGPSAVESDETAPAILRLVESRDVRIGQPRGDMGQHLGPLPATCGIRGKRALGQTGGLQLLPQIADLRQTRLAVARHKHVDKRRERFGILCTGATRDDQRMMHRPLVATQRDPAQIEHRQQIGIADLVLQRKAENVEFGQRSEGLQAVQRQIRLAEVGFHVRPRRKDAFTVPIVASVHQRVQHLQAVMAHPDRVRIGKGQTQPASHSARVFANHIPFAADVLGRHLHSHQDAIDQMLF